MTSKKLFKYYCKIAIQSHDIPLFNKANNNNNK